MNKTDISIIGLWYSQFRAIEIAKVGNFSISLYGSPDYSNAKTDAQMLIDFCKGWFDNFVKNGDMNVELSKPNYNDKYCEYETLKDISERVEKSTLNVLKHEKFDYNTQEFLRMVVSRLNLSTNNLFNIVEISKVIARMDNSETIQTEHVAEAAQYFMINIDGDKLINLLVEDSKISFGGIEISYSNDYTNNDILSARYYLKKLLN